MVELEPKTVRLSTDDMDRVGEFQEREGCTEAEAFRRLLRAGLDAEGITPDAVADGHGGLASWWYSRGPENIVAVARLAVLIGVATLALWFAPLFGFVLPGHTTALLYGFVGSLAAAVVLAVYLLAYGLAVWAVSNPDRRLWGVGG